MLSVKTLVGICLWPISSRAVRRGSASRQLTKQPPTLALAAGAMTCLRMAETVSSEPLSSWGLFGVGVIAEKEETANATAGV